ncbi:MAG: dockerin type I domain-containing protein [bacterium]
MAIDVGAARAVGEAVNGFPNWNERVIHEWINRTRVDPQLEMTACGAKCVEKACYGVMPPLSWSLALNRSARFHSDEMVRQSYFAHTSACTLVSNINSLYPASCDGSAGCACVGGTKACSGACTDFGARVQLFGGSPSGEIIASPSNPNQAFYLWLYEQGDTTSCTFTSSNGHRWLILKSTGAVGAGVAGYSTGDFGAGSAPAKIPSGAHYPQQAASVDAWANWYDTTGPTVAAINVDGVCTAMTLQRGTQTNGAWAATISGAGSGCHRYYFSFRDAGGATVTYPTTGSLAIGSGVSCPDWDAARPASCVVGEESPAPSPTVSLTPSITPTATQTPTRTATASASPTRTPTATRTATPSVSSTPTATGTRTRTATASPSSTSTPTAPPSPTATPTPTGPPSGNDLSGNLRYYSNDEAVPNIAVQAGDAGSAMSDAAGHYMLTDVPLQNVLVSAESDGGTGNAISALDASYVLQSVAGLREFSEAQALACDVTGNGSVSALDAAQILQYAVGLMVRLPVAAACGSDWAFMPNPAPAPGQTLIQPESDAQSCVPGGIAYDAMPMSLDEQNFTAVVFGDCTGNWHAPAAAGAVRMAAAMQRAEISEWRALRGGRLALPIALQRDTAMHAAEVRVDYDASMLRVVSAKLVGPARHALLAINAERPGVLHLAIASGEAIAVDGRPVVVVVFDGLQADDLAAPAVALRFDDD